LVDFGKTYFYASRIDYTEDLKVDFGVINLLNNSRVEVNLFVLSPEIEDRDEAEVGNWAKHKKTF
jgi:hypothetical protein